MLKKVEVKNYKSIEEGSIELGRFNVLIGENGCGKSNFLEAIALGSAASDGHLKNESLVAKGIRVANPVNMRAGFDKNTNKPIEINFEIESIIDGKTSTKRYDFSLQNDNKPYSEWYDVEKKEMSDRMPEIINHLFSENADELKQEVESSDLKTLSAVIEMFKTLNRDDHQSMFNTKGMLDLVKVLYQNDVKAELLSDFTIFSPENTSLRKFDDEELNKPLGVKGEGLFKLLQGFTDEENLTRLKIIKDNLMMMDWFDDFEIIESNSSEKRLRIRDRFTNETLNLDHYNANEGFLFLLFYLCLFVSKDTPKTFAIDNLEASFNPKLCREIARTFIDLSNKFDKQVIVTTHNPYILDGLDLSKDGVRLFSVFRNIEGKTCVKRIIPKSQGSIKLSEAWMKGYLGGLPKNF